jgi:hypothetical protein
MTVAEIRAAYERADASMKAKEGHSYLIILKTRCQYCGRSPNQKGKCKAWFQTFLDCLTTELMEITK